MRKVSRAIEWEQSTAAAVAAEMRAEPTDFGRVLAKVDSGVFERWVERRVYIKDPDSVKATAVAKIGLNFAQTLGAIANYAKPLGGSGGVADGSLPRALLFFQTFSDIGFSYSAVKCAFVLSYRTRLVGFMVAPFISAGAPPLLLLAAKALKARRPDLVAFDDDRALAQASFYSMLLTFLVLPASIDTLAIAQNCAPDSSGAFLFVNPEESCKDDAYIAYMLAAKVLGYVFLFVPVLVGLAVALATRAKMRAAADEAAADAANDPAAAAAARASLPRFAGPVLRTFSFLIEEYREAPISHGKYAIQTPHAHLPSHPHASSPLTPLTRSVGDGCARAEGRARRPLDGLPRAD
jgi:hypothetical protein